MTHVTKSGSGCCVYLFMRFFILSCSGVRCLFSVVSIRSKLHPYIKLDGPRVQVQALSPVASSTIPLSSGEMPILSR